MAEYIRPRRAKYHYYPGLDVIHSITYTHDYGDKSSVVGDYRWWDDGYYHCRHCHVIYGDDHRHDCPNKDNKVDFLEEELKTFKVRVKK